uniref:IncF plasmid conjugative transfer pilus assembly protein TraU n=1 Tax=Klebsiella pneumoniae TaxID=573 RepID=A0A8B0SQF5_KLEPN|nr:IncF plasmid conjugative transfer pilus assembly protein TraU [Klebsiella pneumoniae]
MKAIFLICIAFSTFSGRAAADPSCEGRFVNPITDVCWRCIFPLSLGSVQVGKGDLPDTSNPGSPPAAVSGSATAFCSSRPGHRVLGADGHDGRQPFARLYGQSGGFSINLGKTGMGTARKDDKQVNGAFYHVHWYKYPLTYWLNIITSAGCLEGGDMDIALSVRD